MRLLVLVQKRARVREGLHRLPEITFFSFFRVPPATKIVVTEVTSTDHTDSITVAMSSFSNTRQSKATVRYCLLCVLFMGMLAMCDQFVSLK